MATASNSDQGQPTAISPEEQARRREAMYNALVQVRLEGLEPDPIFFEYAERYSHGELSIEEAVADYTARIMNAQRAAGAR